MTDPHHDQPAERAGAERSDLAWAWAGAKGGLSTPGVVLFGSFFGYGAMTHDFGWPLWIATFSTLLVWAAPAQVVLAGALASGAGLAAATLAVSVSGVRLLPMVVSILPVLRSERTTLAGRLFAAHYVAVTAWFEGLRLTPMLPRPARMPFFIGLSNMLTLGSALATAAGHAAAGVLPPALSIGLLALSPLYFLLSLERSSRTLGERMALGLGLVLAPLFTALTPKFDLLLVGLVGGTAAFAIERFVGRRRAS